MFFQFFRILKLSGIVFSILVDLLIVCWMLWQSKEWIVFVILVILSYSDTVVWAILFYGWLYCSVSLSFLCGNLSDLQLPIIYIYIHIYINFCSYHSTCFY